MVVGDQIGWSGDLRAAKCSGIIAYDLSAVHSEFFFETISRTFFVIDLTHYVDQYFAICQVFF